MYLTTARMDLPYAVTYKKIKHNKKYEYSNNKIDRSGHTYLDYLSYIHRNPGIYTWQLDFLGAIKTDNNAILSFILPNLQFTIIKLFKNPNPEKVVTFFDNIESKIDIETFKVLIPIILTNRDFADIQGICFYKITGEERCELFFYDPYVSNQKPNEERTIDNGNSVKYKNKYYQPIKYDQMIFLKPKTKCLVINCYE